MGFQYIFRGSKSHPLSKKKLGLLGKMEYGFHIDRFRQILRPPRRYLRGAIVSIQSFMMRRTAYRRCRYCEYSSRRRQNVSDIDNFLCVICFRSQNSCFIPQQMQYKTCQPFRRRGVMSSHSRFLIRKLAIHFQSRYFKQHNYINFFICLPDEIRPLPLENVYIFRVFSAMNYPRVVFLDPMFQGIMDDR